MAVKHILVVSQYFYPESFRINDMCMDWVKRGYKVTVITGIPNYPMGKTYAGYGIKKNRHEVWNGIEIIRLPLIPRGRSSIGMALNYLSFMISGIIAGKFMKINADIVFSFEVSPMTQVLTGVCFAKRLHIPHYLYVQDLWPENVIAVTGIKSKFVITPIDKMVDKIYKDTDRIFASSPSFVEAICNRKITVDREKVHYWPQYAEDYYLPCKKKSIPEIPIDDSFKVVFTGNVGTAQGLDILPKTAKLLLKENVKFVIVGDGRYLSALVKEIKENDIEDKFIFIPRQPAHKIPEILCSCDVAFLSFSNNFLYSMTIPAKLQSYMACGMPIIAAARGETKRIIDDANCGMCCDIGNAEAICDLIKNAKNKDLSLLGKNGRLYYEKHFDKTLLMNEMDSYFNQY